MLELMCRDPDYSVSEVSCDFEPSKCFYNGVLNAISLSAWGSLTVAIGQQSDSRRWQPTEFSLYTNV